MGGKTGEFLLLSYWGANLPQQNCPRARIRRKKAGEGNPGGEEQD